ncbi:hypothetical protein CBA19CS11_29545 [Caballeronia novacaledonica]|uniref:hypothetical protein n=1 Tax=Caballeronia novacaledonica TaxID=1544861 RepID=UPI000785D306|nr:hypothetical protein [Caballeronia novacaledonica]KXV05038.1 hypothetical protein CR51_13050 [Caballeronia megalochromosomata]GJH13069.1 hypothetical protein CBA19CS11_29545 [Caballeronia novacaledonica]
MTSTPWSDPPAEVIAALRALDELVVKVELNGQDIHSIEAAIHEVEAAIDATVAKYRAHPLIESAVAEIKAECRAGLYEQTDATKASLTPYAGANKQTLH